MHHFLSQKHELFLTGRNLNKVAALKKEFSMEIAELNKNPVSMKISSAMHALERIGSPENVVRVIAFFLMPDNNWITGQVLAVDGGLNRVRPKPHENL